MYTRMVRHRLPLLRCCLFCVFCVSVLPAAYGDPCTDGTHSCDVSSQRCVADNSTANFTCHCLRADQQLDQSSTCTDIPDSQILYLTTPVDTSKSDRLKILEVLSNPEMSQATLRNMYQPLANLSTFKDVKFIEFRGLGVVPDFSTAVYALLFTENVTSEIREAVARAVLLTEQVGVVQAPNGVTVEIPGHMGIFDTEENSRNDEDDMDWCSYPSLYTCRTNSTCNDVGLRYECPCDPGFVDDGANCYECVDKFQYGTNCTEVCTCVINKTVSCDRANGTCYCKEHWEGERCDQDVNECAKSDDLCGNPAFFQCINEEEGYRCACAEGMSLEADTGECRGAAIIVPSPFDTDGTRDLHLVCEVSSATEVTQYEWSDVCLQTEGNRCTIMPQPPWDDGKKVTCVARLANGESYTGSVVLELNYPPPSAPLVEGYRSGDDRLRPGDSLKMTCSVLGGKPLASSLLFHCPRHRPLTPDDVITNSNGVTGVLTLQQLTSEDDGAVCTCSAVWKRRLWYRQLSTVVLRLREGDGAAQSAGLAQEGLDTKWYILYGVLGLYLIVILILIIIVCRYQAPDKYLYSSPPSTQNTSAGTTGIGTDYTGKGSTTGMGSSPSHLDRRPPLGPPGYLENTELSGPPPNRHIWRHRGWPSLTRRASAEDLSTWTSQRRAGPDPHSRRRRNSLTSDAGVYDQIGGGLPDDFVPSGDTSEMYLHPPGVDRDLSPGYPYLTPRNPYTRYIQGGRPEDSQGEATPTTTPTPTPATTGAGQEMAVPSTGAGNDPALY